LDELPADIRFQVSLPTPLAVINQFNSPKHAARVEGPYETAVVRVRSPD